MARILVSVESYLLFQTPKVINQNIGKKIVKDRERGGERGEILKKSIHKNYKWCLRDGHLQMTNADFFQKKLKDTNLEKQLLLTNRQLKTVLNVKSRKKENKTEIILRNPSKIHRIMKNGSDPIEIR